MSKSNNQIKTGQNTSPGSLSRRLDHSLNLIRSILGDSKDVIIREMKIFSDTKVDAAVIYIDGLVDRDLISRDVLHPLMFNLQLIKDKIGQNHPGLLDYVKSSVLTASQIEAVTDIDNVISNIMKGKTAVLAQGTAQVLIVDTKGWEKRAIDNPKNEVSMRGPQDSFTETLRINTAMLRRKIRDPNLTFIQMQIGQRSKTDVAIAYVKGITPDSLIKEIKLRLDKINTDAILDAGYIEQFIEDNPLSFFPTIGSSERPDVVTARILEGRAAILVDGSPMALTAPFLFTEGFQNPDDYYARPYFASFVRAIRLFGFLVSVYLPALYVSLSAFHPEIYPTSLLITVAAAREGIPFPVVLEALLMLLLFEILREAGLRMPRSLGQAVSIVGALVIGQAAVSAGLVGAPMVIVVATTAITSFMVVPYADPGAVFRFILTVVAGFLGLFGVILVSLEILSHLSALRTLGVPYLSHAAPFNFLKFKDNILRTPLWAMEYRPASLAPLDARRQSPGQMPHPPNTEEKGRS